MSVSFKSHNISLHIKKTLTENRCTYRVAECEYHKQPAIGQGSMFANSATEWFSSIKLSWSSCSICSFIIGPLKFCNYIWNIIINMMC